MDELRRFGFVEEKLRTERAGDPHLPQWLSTLTFSRLQAEAVVRWADQTLAGLESPPA
jgi:hypothetical protein